MRNPSKYIAQVTRPRNRQLPGDCELGAMAGHLIRSICLRRNYVDMA
jgi:hypothetical protein